MLFENEEITGWPPAGISFRGAPIRRSGAFCEDLEIRQSSNLAALCAKPLRSRRILSLLLSCVFLLGCTEEATHTPIDRFKPRAVAWTARELGTTTDETVTAVCFSPDGSTLVSGGCDNTIRLWDVETGLELQAIEGLEDEVRFLGFLHGGRKMISASYDSIRVWDLSATEEIGRQSPHGGITYCVAISPDGSIFASAGYDNTICLWNALTLENLFETRATSYSHASAMAFSPKGDKLAVGSRNSAITLWEVDLDQGRLVYDSQWIGHQKPVRSLQFSPDGGLLASGSSDSFAIVWNTATSLEQFRLGHNARVESIAFSPTGAYLLTSASDNTIRIWDMKIGVEADRITGPTVARKFAWDLYNYEGPRLRSLAFSPDGRLLACGTEAGTVLVWDLPRDFE